MCPCRPEGTFLFTKKTWICALSTVSEVLRKPNCTMDRQQPHAGTGVSADRAFLVQFEISQVSETRIEAHASTIFSPKKIASDSSHATYKGRRFF